jgi:hypothetical protein
MFYFSSVAKLIISALIILLCWSFDSYFLLSDTLIQQKIWVWQYLRLVKVGIIIIMYFLGTTKLLN